MSNYMDFSTAEDASGFDPIPKGTVVKVVLNLKAGGSDMPERGITGGWVKAAESGAKYIDCDAVILEGKYAKRHVFFKIGLYSPKGATYENMGRSMIKSILASARNVKDDSVAEKSKLSINHIGELNGLEFYAELGIEKDMNGDPRNTVARGVPASKYNAVSSGGSSGANDAYKPQAAAVGEAKTPW